MQEKEIKRYDNDIFAAFASRVVTRLWVVIILLIAYCGVMTYLYIDVRNSYESIQSEIELEAPDGYIDHAYISGVGDVYCYGEDQSSGENP